MSKRDYYEILGVNRDCDEDDIKKAYRKLAMKHHPDRNPDNPKAEEHFKEAKEAYEILSVTQTRAAYDQYGHAGVDSAGGAPMASVMRSAIYSATSLTHAVMPMFTGALICVITLRSHLNRRLEEPKPRFASPGWRFAILAMAVAQGRERRPSLAPPAMDTGKFACSRDFSRSSRLVPSVTAVVSLFLALALPVPVRDESGNIRHSL